MLSDSLRGLKEAGKWQLRRYLSSGAYFDTRGLKAHKPTKLDFSYSHKQNLHLASPSQTRRIRHAAPVEIQVYAGMFKAKISATDQGLDDKKPPYMLGGIRGNVTGFSKASRKRMIEYMARIRHTGSMMFATMTYSDDVLLRGEADVRAHFEAFRRRLERTFPAWRALWRIELQDRKSGELIGEIVPHFHILIFTDIKYDDNLLNVITNSFASWASVAWHEIIGSTDPNGYRYGFHCTPVRNRKHAMSYISKYIGKESTDDYEIGRRWGRIGKFDVGYSETFRLTEDENIIFKRLIRRWLRNKNVQYARKFSRTKIDVSYSIYGLGDTTVDNNEVGIYSGIYSFILEAQRIVCERKELERSFGC